MKRKELEQIVFKTASDLMMKQGETLLKEGLVRNIKGKKIDNMYHIYGTINSKGKSKEYNTHIKINLLKKKMEGMKCTCDDFREISSTGYLFMCSHLTATAYKFFSMISKNMDQEDESSGRPYTDNTVSEANTTGKLVRKVIGDVVYYEGQFGTGRDRVKITPEELRFFLESIKNRKIKFRYQYLEFVTPIFHKDIPLSFTIKERNGQLVLTTHKQLPISLNMQNDVFLYKNELYLPSKDQIERYIPLYKKFKKDGEILFPKDVYNYSRLITYISSISQSINISEEIRNCMSGYLKPCFFVYEEDNGIYCDVRITYGDKGINILKDNRGRDYFIRDYKKEEKILMEIEKYKFIRRKDRLMFIGDEEDLFNILSGHRSSIHSLGIVTLGKGLKERQVYTSASIRAEFYEKDGCIDFSYSIGNFDGKELRRAFTAYKQRVRFYKTRNNGFLDFEDEGVRCFFDLLEALNADSSIESEIVAVDKRKVLFLNEIIKNKGVNFILGVEALRRIENKIYNAANGGKFIPQKLKGMLREYQVSGYSWLKNLSELGFGGILADEMGLGKTIQTIAFIASEENKRTFIICPTSLIYNWKDEFEKFAPDIKVGIAHGRKSERLKLIEILTQYDVILTTYGTLRMDIKDYENTVFDYCIIDEGQNIKNSLAQNTQVIKEIKAKVRFALTGTPIENNLSELWSIFDFIMPGYLYSKEEFEQKFVADKEDNLESLKLLIKPFILRRTKQEVMKELPDKIEKKFIVEMTAGQKAVYSTYIKSVRERIKSSSENIEIFSYLMKLRQICLDPSLIIDGYTGGGGKLNIALDLIKDHLGSGSKVLLFSQFTSVLMKIGESLEGEGIQYFYLDGSTKPKERLRLVNEFNKNDAVGVFLISLKAGGTGLNLVSANLVIHFDPWWNPAVESQASDRAHRIGQKNIVEVIKLIAKGTIEEKIILLQEDKKELIDSVITGELHNSNIINKLSKDELLQLFYR